MNKKTTTLIHAAVWLVLFVSPLMTINHEEAFSATRILMFCLPPAMMMAVFYLNYLWLTPRYFIRGNKQIYFTVNILLIVSLGILQHLWIHYAHQLMGDTFPPHRHPDTIMNVFFILRNIFTLGIAAAIATTITLSLRWQASEEARLEAETARTEAELKNLRSQVNPHFLLNTLNNIYALTAFDSAKAQQAIHQLSKMLRHMLYDNQQQTIELKDEVLFMQNYVSLMKLRLPANVDVTFTQNLCSGDVRVAPLIFISLIENAFKHGVSPTESSFINISITANTQHIECCIENSNFPKTETDRSGHGVGLQQVARRLELTYPGHYHWEKGASPDGKTYKSVIQIERT